MQEQYCQQQMDLRLCDARDRDLGPSRESLGKSQVTTSWAGQTLKITVEGVSLGSEGGELA